MSEQRSQAAELAKYPLLVFSILIALVLAKFLLGLEFGAITEVSTGGVKFAEKSQATLAALANLESKVNQAASEIEAIKKSLSDKTGGPTASSTALLETTQTVSGFEATQTVSDQTARVEEIGVSDPLSKQKIRGYIWIGNFKNSWAGIQLAKLDSGQPVALPPEQIQKGTEYAVLGNMVVRDGLPANDKEYFRGRNSIGVLPRGTRIRIVKPPEGIDREYAVQYWAEIEVP